MATSGNIAFGTQLDPFGGGSNTRGALVTVLKAGSSTYAYYTSGTGLFGVNITSVDGGVSTTLPGFQANTWPLAKNLVSDGQSGSTYLFASVGRNPQSLKIGQVSSNGTITDVGSYAPSSLKSLDVSYQGGVYWIFLNEYPTKIEVMKFDPALSSITHLVDVPSDVISSGVYRAYTNIIVRGSGSSLVLVGSAINTSSLAILGYDLIGVGSIASGGTPAKINVPQAASEQGLFEAYIQGNNAYLYRLIGPDSTNNPILLRPTRSTFRAFRRHRPLLRLRVLACKISRSTLGLIRQTMSATCSISLTLRCRRPPRLPDISGTWTSRARSRAAGKTRLS